MDPLIALLLSAGLTTTGPAVANSSQASAQTAALASCPDPLGGRLDAVEVIFPKGANVSRSANLPDLLKLAAALRGSNCRIRIDGYSDEAGSPSEKKSISERRATAVRDYLTGQRITADRIEAVGQGERQGSMPSERKRVARVLLTLP